MRQLVDRLVSDRLVMAVIVLNAAALVLHEMAPRGTSIRALWFWVDYICVIFFLAEALVKIGRDGWSLYWESAWNKFDFTVVVLSLPALLGPFFD
ncbi:MAG: ion transporter, partial [Acidobacteriota bacterium]|nr:ion transporter [Acidobacteriota bacterium]